MNLIRHALPIAAAAALAACAHKQTHDEYATFVLPQEAAARQDQTPVGQAEPATKCAVYFDLDSAEIRADQKPTIRRCAEEFRSSSATVALEGHADPTGPESHNRKLSEQRARAVQQALQQEGIERGRLRAEGKGEEQLAAELHDNESMLSESRRVDMATRRAGAASGSAAPAAASEKSPADRWRGRGVSAQMGRLQDEIAA